MTVRLRFFGAAGTVTGSKYLVEWNDVRILVDAGLFQGDDAWEELNRDDAVLKVDSLDAVLLTHAHVDHVGLLPRYRKLGLGCPVFCTSATAELAETVLLDSGRLHEEDWRPADPSAAGMTTRPDGPLYTEADARDLLPLLSPVGFGTTVEVLPGVTAEWRRSGHILGSASIVLKLGGKTIVFSGDVGRYDVPILRDPEPVPAGDLLLVESTYGDEDHSHEPLGPRLAKIVTDAAARRGALIIPSFAIGRTQLLLYVLRELSEAKLIPPIPVVVDSPMARDVTVTYSRHPGDYDEEMLGIAARGTNPFVFPLLRFVRDRGDSKRLNDFAGPIVIISASGMLTGGRVLHHLRHRLPDPRTTVLFVGYQPPGGRGGRIQRGEPVTLFGDEVPVRAHVETLSGFSAHADRRELLRWCGDVTGTPRRVAVVHGEPQAAASFAEAVRDTFGWDSFVPTYGLEVEA